MRTLHVTDREHEYILGALAQQVLELTGDQVRDGMDPLLAKIITKEQKIGAQLRALFERLQAGEPPAISDGGMAWSMSHGALIIDGGEGFAVIVTKEHVPADDKARDELATAIGFALGLITA